jgi:multidrug efflux system membrane fusion protein
LFRIIMLLFGILTSCENREEKGVASDDEIPVQAIEPTISDVFLNLELIGTLKAMTTVDLYPQVSGHLLAVLVQEGEWVKTGTPLFKIDPQSYTLKMKEAEAQITIDKAALAAIQRKLNRLSRLNDKDLIAESEWDKHHTEAAKIAGQVDLDSARMEMIALTLSQCTITAPIDGRIGKIDTSPGQVVVANQITPLTTILQMDPLLVEFALTENEFEQVQEQAKPIQIYPLCKPESRCAGEITFIDNQFEVKTGQILVRGRIPNPEHAASLSRSKCLLLLKQTLF